MQEPGRIDRPLGLDLPALDRARECVGLRFGELRESPSRMPVLSLGLERIKTPREKRVHTLSQVFPVALQESGEARLAGRGIGVFGDDSIRQSQQRLELRRRQRRGIAQLSRAFAI